jgi:5-methyltetrahydropteroyltriglutamate--homocysteine methyltransferase
MAALGLSDDFKFLRANTERETKYCITGPHSLCKRIRNKYYPNDEALATDIARVMNMELKELVKAGATFIQIDEPYYSGFPEDLSWGVKVMNTLVDGVNAKIALHICYGNRYGKPSWEGNYRYLFPRITDANVQQLTLEFARRGGADLSLFKDFKVSFELGVGVIDVKDEAIETPEIVAERIRAALRVLPPEKIVILPDCGLFHLSRDLAFAKLRSMVAGARLVRNDLEGQGRTVEAPQTRPY